MSTGHHADGAGRDHDHDDEPDVPLEQNPIWQQDNVTLHSVGVDIGSSGTQLAFSRLHLRRLSEDLTSRYVVVRRESLYESPVHLTPFGADLRIDAARLGALLDEAYAEARVTPEMIDTGAVILTGEALRRRNSEAIAEVVSERAGELVCATAGHHMEAMLSAYGSGAVRTSSREHSRLLNIDIGGGTTKLTLVEDGRIAGTAAFHVGGRLIAVAGGVVTRIEPGGHRHALRAGHDLALGSPVTGDQLDDVAALMAGELLGALAGRHTEGLWLTEPLLIPERLDGIVFSGGVAEYVYGTQTADFGDLGRRLGGELRRSAERALLPAPVLPAAERIRATVLGASQYTVQLSGITSHLDSAEGTLPRRNLPVARPAYVPGDTVDSAAMADTLRKHLDRFTQGDLAVALSWSGDPEYHRLRAFGEGIVKGLSPRLTAGERLYLVVDGDIARTLGRILRDELGVENDLLILDGLLLRDFDYVDLGRVRQPSGTVPVTIKSLLFNDMDASTAP
ncbi:ethanolamine ammonia-lyase reactivating factor EutA [Nonomuraea jiangxiensis]|uniref:Ethanolamine utilization protein EutA n=1 Tax=Nonomuraea jiangxiensis TaxID=633440 RepID=A0A1G9SMF7_9ACTN|nr:ethanolamine ammonia-lyase reactivating factor EutA [Nonomuraea jiangxiensis]SDM36624.1 ethanolamine utilization protein EutA [Nonomuraea jiangxiensis]